MPRIKDDKPTKRTSERKRGPLKRTKAGGLLGTQSKYKNDWPERIIELMSEGRSLVEVARELNTTVVTLRNLTKKVPLLKSAMEIGIEWSEAWWSKEGREALKDRSYNVAMYQLQVRNRFKWDVAKDKFEAKVKGSGKDGSLSVTISKEEAACG